MSNCRWPVLVPALLIFAVSAFANKSGARLERLGNVPTQDIRVGTSLSAADTCFVTSNGELIFRIDGWVAGNELYKSLMDPAASCANPYPFTISEINMPMAFDGGTPLTVSVDIETIDSTSVPGCKIPGQILTISKDWNLDVPATGGLFNIWIPLDTPITVNGPFFAGFFIGNQIDPAVNPAVLTDSLPAVCTNYNVWDENIGWVDLNQNDFFNFPGRLAMEVTGIPGGSGGGGTDTTAPPATVWLTPQAGDTLSGNADLWAWDSAGSPGVDYVVFEYSFGGGSFVEIGRDLDGFSPVRGGTGSSASGSGFSYDWDFSTLSEGSYTLRATIFDTSGRSSAASTTVYLEPTPPVPTIVSPANNDKFCSPLTVTLSVPDENTSFVEFFRKPAAFTYIAGLTPTSQFAAGDVNGNPNDGNLAVNGEFGNYYSGPIGAAMALKLWADRGVTQPMMQGSSMMSIPEAAEALAIEMGTRDNTGTDDEHMVYGLRQYMKNHWNALAVGIERNPNYLRLRSIVEEQERVVLLGLSGASSIWVAVDGFNGFQRPDGYWDIKIANPLTGAIELQPWRDVGGYSELFFNSSWHRVDVMVSLVPSDWAVSRQLLGVDLSGGDGWGLNWTSSGLTEDSVYFVTARGRDAGGLRGMATIMLQYACSSVYKPGDYNNDGFADISDLLFLIDYVATDGPSPAGGGLRADANCDTYVNIADIVYYLNYLFGQTGTPCY